MEPEYNFEELPEEVISQIGSYLPYRELGRFGRTYSTGQRISREIMEKKKEEEDINSFYAGIYWSEKWVNPTNGYEAFIDGMHRKGEPIDMIKIEIDSPNFPFTHNQTSFLETYGVPKEDYPRIYRYLKSSGFELQGRDPKL